MVLRLFDRKDEGADRSHLDGDEIKNVKISFLI